MIIHEEDAVQIKDLLRHFLTESSAAEVLLIDRSGQLLAMDGVARALDTVSISALAAGAFSSTGAMAQLLGESEFTVLFHEGVKQNIHVSTVDAEAILLAIFDERTTVGMVRLFAKETARAIGGVLAEARSRPRRAGSFATPLVADEVGPTFPAAMAPPGPSEPPGGRME
jgi:predicted regulator of Ras-like GTPase activity (Roadblock/LC7/MglB family)